MDYIIYGVFTLSMLCFPAYFLMLSLKKRKEQKELSQQEPDEQEPELQQNKFNITNIDEGTTKQD